VLDEGTQWWECFLVSGRAFIAKTIVERSSLLLLRVPYRVLYRIVATSRRYSWKWYRKFAVLKAMCRYAAARIESDTCGEQYAGGYQAEVGDEALQKPLSQLPVRW
jgi:hypothetical protein